MNKKLITIVLIITLFFSFLPVYNAVELSPGTIYEESRSNVYRSINVYAPAVATTNKGYVGVISTVTVSIQNNGTGRVFVDTLPLTQVDMQGSARLAVKVASSLVRNDENCDVDPNSYDYFFVVRTDAPIIGGPSAGGIMATATVSLLEKWDMDNRTIMTGMINPDGSIGPVGGITQKIDAADTVGANRFLIPKGQSTYTEMVTTTESNNGWIRTITKPVTKNVTDYAMENYGIEVNEVEDINDVVEYFTGNRFDFEESNKPITTEDYNSSIKPLATTLLKEAKESYKNSSEKFDESSIPNYFPNYYRNDIKDKLDKAEETLEGSKKWYNESLYYTSTSKSFQSLIYSRFVSYTCDYYEDGNKEWIEDLLTEVDSLHNNVSKLAKNAEIDGVITLQTVGAAQRRASEAGEYLESAKQIYDGKGFSSFSELMDFLYSISFVVERCNSVHWWIDIGNKFNDTEGEINDTIENLALEYIEEVQQSVIYSEVILGEMGSISDDSAEYLDQANDLLDTSKDDLDKGYTAASLFEALEALVKANIAIEIIGTNVKEKLDLASESANKNIAKIRKQGIEPVLAVSYYEYAESLRNESAYNSALVYYKYSGMIAGALSFTNLSSGTGSFKNVGIPDRKNVYENVIWIVFGGIFIGLVIGIGVGILIGSIDFSGKEKQKKKKKAEKKIEYDGFVEYKSSEKKDYKYPDDEIPKSIRDYYKKNK